MVVLVGYLSPPIYQEPLSPTLAAGVVAREVALVGPVSAGLAELLPAQEVRLGCLE